MIALFLVVALFLYLTFIGQAVISLLRPRLGLLWSWFIAPTVGLALLITIITHLSVRGLPVKAFGPWLTIGLLVGATVILAWRRPKFPWRQLRPFLIIACGSLLYFGWPLLCYGFNWISYGNDDMTNYCLGADRFLNHGYYDVPTLVEIKGRDYTQAYWFMHAVGQLRSGSELAIAWVTSITGLNVHQVYMPVILMLGLLQLFALGALAMVRGRHRHMAILAFFLLAISPLFGLGMLYQLIAQVGGLALFLAATSVLVSTNFASMRKMLLASLLTCALCMFYPETTPFLALGILFFSMRTIWTRKINFNRYALFITATALFTFLLLGTNIFEYLITALNQVGSAGKGAGKLSIFPWTLVPSYIPIIFGLHSYGTIGSDPVVSIQIAAGLILSGYALKCIWSSIVSDSAAGFIGLVMLLLGIELYLTKNDFGLFKLAMYAQPILALSVAQHFSRLTFNKNLNIQRAARWGVAGFFVCTLPIAFNYAHSSLGEKSGGLAEVRDASRLGVKFTPPSDLQYDSIYCDISNVSSAKMLMLYTKNIDTYFLSRNYIVNIESYKPSAIFISKSPAGRDSRNIPFLHFFFPKKFLLSPIPYYVLPAIITANNSWTDTSSHEPNHANSLFIALRGDLDGFNKLSPDNEWRAQGIYQYKLERQVRNRLVFIHSKLGQQYFLSDRLHVAIYQRESDPTMPGNVSFHGTGHYTVFEIINPSSSFRMVLDFTCSPLGADRCLLPKNAAIVGAGKYPLSFVGRGSARIVSPPMRPEFLQHNAYLTVDFGRDGLPFVTPKTGLMRLYGVERNLDDRRLVGFTRDISLLTEEQYRALPRPTSISRFPEDLMQYAGLEYSGLSEDGWVAGDSYFKLGRSRPGQVLLFRGLIPIIPAFASKGIDLTLFINGKVTGPVVHLRPGDFALTMPISKTSDITSVAFHFSDAQACTEKGDQRIVSAFVHEISIRDTPDFFTFRQLTDHSSDQFGFTGTDLDGWINRTATFKTPAFPEFKMLKMDLEMPGWSSLANNELKIFLNSRLIQTAVMPRGTDQSFYLPLVAGAPAEVRLESAAAFVLPNEKRERCFLIKNLSFEDPSPVSGFDRTGVDNDGWLDRTATLKTPAFPEGTVLKLDLEMPGWSSLASNEVKVFLNGRLVQTAVVPRGADQSLYVPLMAGAPAEVRLESAAAFALPNEKRERCFLVKAVSFEDVAPADLFTRGWHKSGYSFVIDRADADGWVDRQVAFRFPATTQFKAAIVEVVRFPAKADLPLAVSVNGTAPMTHTLGLERPELLRIPLSATADITATLATEQSFPLAAPDTRERSFRIVNIDFE